MSEFELDNAGNSEAQQKQATAYLFPQSAPGVAITGILVGLGVLQNTTADGNVLIAGGSGVVQSGVSPGVSLLVNDTTKTLNVLGPNPVGGLPRNDIVVFNSVTATIAVIVGTPNATPSDPTVPATALPLARLRHAASATTIPTAKIDALRKFTGLVGTPIPVNNAAERDALTPLSGMRVDRLDLDRIERYSGTVWRPVSGKMPHRSLVRSAPVTVPTSVETAIGSGFDVSPDDGGDACGITYGSGILTCGFTGIYGISAQMNYGGINAIGHRQVIVYVNGVKLMMSAVGGHEACEYPTLNRRVKFNAGDTVQMYAYQSSGIGGNVLTADTFWQLTYVCPA